MQDFIWAVQDLDFLLKIVNGLGGNWGKAKNG